jgi:uncharacterized protein YndB with AHSA1/START domain
MKERSIVHGSFVVERSYAASPKRVFEALTTREAKSRWFVGPEDHEAVVPLEMDIRVGGRERIAGGPRGGPVHRYEALYQDIVPNERLVYTYEMYADDRRTSVSLGTMELSPDGPGTRLVYTEQAAFLDGLDTIEAREHGTRDLLDALGRIVDTTDTPR